MTLVQQKVHFKGFFLQTFFFYQSYCSGSVMDFLAHFLFILTAALNKLQQQVKVNDLITLSGFKIRNETTGARPMLRCLCFY